MNFEQEKKRVQRMNRTELNLYEKQLKELQAEASRKTAAAEEERKASYDDKSLCVPGSQGRFLIKAVLALSKENRLKDLSKAVQIRKNQLLTPAERNAREAKRRLLLERLAAD